MHVQADTMMQNTGPGKVHTQFYFLIFFGFLIFWVHPANKQQRNSIYQQHISPHNQCIPGRCDIPANSHSMFLYWLAPTVDSICLHACIHVIYLIYSICRSCYIDSLICQVVSNSSIPGQLIPNQQTNISGVAMTHHNDNDAQHLCWVACSLLTPYLPSLWQQTAWHPPYMPCLLAPHLFIHHS